MTVVPAATVPTVGTAWRPAGLVAELGPAARAEHAAGAAAAADVAVLAFPYHPDHVLPVAELADTIVLDTHNCMIWRDGHLPDIDSGRVTEHELRQQQLPTSRLAKAFTHVQAPTLLRLARPAGAPDRLALSVSSDHPDAVAFATRLDDQIGYDTVDNSPLRESWRSGPRTPAWQHHDRQGREALAAHLRRATRVNAARASAGRRGSCGAVPRRGSRCGRPARHPLPRARRLRGVPAPGRTGRRLVQTGWQTAPGDVAVPTARRRGTIERMVRTRRP